MGHGRYKRLFGTGLTYLDLTSGAQYVHGGAGAFNGAILGVLVRVVLKNVPPNATRMIAGTNNFASGGFGVIGETYGGQPGAPQGRVVGYSGTYTSSATENLDLYTTPALGRLISFFHQIVPASAVHIFADGLEIGIGGTTALASFASAQQLGINTRPGALGTLPFGAMGIVELQTTTSALTAAEIAAACRAPVGSVLPGRVSQMVASDLGAPGEAAGATWPDRVNGVTYTIVGGPSLARISRPTPGLGCFEIMGDSIAGGRNASTFLGAGWRKESLFDVNGVRHLAANGQFTFTDPATTLDFDARHTCIGGQALGVPAGALTPRLTTVAADRVISIAPTGITGIAYGINDLVYRVNTLGQTAADAVAAFLVDLDAEVAGLRVTRTGPILVQNTMRISTTAAGSNATVRAAIDLLFAALPGARDTLNATYGSIPPIVDCYTPVTPTQAAADDTGVLFDGTHPTPTSYTTMGQTWGAAQRSLGLI